MQIEIAIAKSTSDVELSTSNIERWTLSAGRFAKIFSTI